MICILKAQLWENVQILPCLFCIWEKRSTLFTKCFSSPADGAPPCFTSGLSLGVHTSSAGLWTVDLREEDVTKSGLEKQRIRYLNFIFCVP